MARKEGSTSYLISVLARFARFRHTATLLNETQSVCLRTTNRPVDILQPEHCIGLVSPRAYEGRKWYKFSFVEQKVLPRFGTRSLLSADV